MLKILKKERKKDPKDKRLNRSVRVLFSLVVSLFCPLYSTAPVHPTWDLLNSILYSPQGLAPSILDQGQESTQPHIVSH